MITSQVPVIWINLTFGGCAYCGKQVSECQFCKYGDNIWTEGKM